MRAAATNRRDYQIISGLIDQGARVLDLGCGDGALLSHLQDVRKVSGYGIELDDAKVRASVKNGINVVQADLERGLSGFNDSSFDYVILSLTLQTVHHTEKIVREMLRVGKQVIVTFPNFGFWKHRIQIFTGRVPVSKSLPYEWYNTPNIHVLTIKDFEMFCDTHNMNVIDRIVLNEAGNPITVLPNFLGMLAIYRFDKK
ncbi:MAG: methionine biosynthesis protein MetW [Betaproteobacteria bacterium]